MPMTQEEREAEDAKWAAGAAERGWNKIRKQREPLLIEADYLINIAEDAGQGASALRMYRQALRDITTDFANPVSVVWPEKP